MAPRSQSAAIMAPVPEDAGQELDLTNAHLPSLVDVELPAGLTVRGRGGTACTRRRRRLLARRQVPLQPCKPPLQLCDCCHGYAWLHLHVQSLDLTANRLRSLEPNLLALTGLRRLCLRQNLVSRGEDVEALGCAPGACLCTLTRTFHGPIVAA